MKNVYLYIAAWLIWLSCYGQDYNNHWQLGQIDLDFSNNPGSAIIIPPPATPNYGYATISDSVGNLLFYTDGNKVWNKNHTIMPNGNIGMFGNNVYQKSIIIPHPNDINKYYVIASSINGTLSSSSTASYYFYCLVDFTNNTLGDVLLINPNAGAFETPYIKILKDQTGYINLENITTFAPLTSVKTPDNNYWVIVQSKNMMLSYKIDTSGFNDIPVISTFPAYQIYDIGQFNMGIQACIFRAALNSNTSKLYSLQYSFKGNSTDPLRHSSKFHSLDFDSLTGVFSNYQPITVNGPGVAYNFELSPDYTKAYFVLYERPMIPTGDGEIVVKDLISPTINVRSLYESNNSNILGSKFSSIQRDKYGNLIISSNTQTNNRNLFFHKIENPNSFASSSLDINYISLNGKPSPEFFPQLIPDYIENCINDITLNTPETNSNYTFQAANSITTVTNYNVDLAQDISLKAGEFVVMKSGTHLKSGSKVLAKIENCETGPTTQRITYSYGDKNAEASTGKKLTLYPNPANAFVSVASGDGITSISITSLDGKLMYQKEYSGKETSTEIDVRSYTNGIYMISITTAKGEIQTTKLIKN